MRQSSNTDNAEAERPDEDRGWQEFREQCRRQMKRPLDQRIRYGFFRMHKPVLDDAPWRAFDTLSDYRAWAEAALPRYLGFHRGET